MSIEAYPLHWPPHRKRTPAGERKNAQFHRVERETRQSGTPGQTYTYSNKRQMTYTTAMKRLMSEISAFTKTNQTWIINPDSVIISSNTPTKNDGTPYATARDNYDDPGVAVYFTMHGAQHCLTCDKWVKLADNLTAIAKYVEAMRGQIRWGVADVAQMFAGFKALPSAIITAAPMTFQEAAKWVAAKLPHTGQTTKTNHQQQMRSLAKKFHPDANGGVMLPEWSTYLDAKKVIEEHFAAGAGK